MTLDGGSPDAVDATLIKAVATLDDNSRRSIYAFVGAAGRPVTREQVANAVGISRKLAAFHLDKLVAVGLLEARTEAVRTTGVRGRSPKVYERAARDVSVTLPTRHPDVLAQMLTEAVTTAGPDETAGGAAMRVARRWGHELGSETRGRVPGGRLGPERVLALSESALRRRGYEPAREAPMLLTLGNCPYRPMAAQAPELVCHMNERFLTGFLTGLGAEHVKAFLAPRQGKCCVELRG